MVVQAQWPSISERAPAQNFIAPARLDEFGPLADQIGSSLAQEMLGALSDRLGQIFALVGVGRVGHGVVKISFLGADRGAVVPRLVAGIAALAAPIEEAGERFS